VDLSALATEIMAEIRAADTDRQVTVHIADGLLCVGDQNLLRLALQNMFGNAWKFTAKTPEARIEFGREPEKGPFYIRDNGAGFDMKYAKNLFSAFQRLHSASEFEGTGIGLATVQRIIHRHGGRIFAEAEPGRGATFYFTVGPRGGLGVTADESRNDPASGGQSG
jgi:light-regulated signal transduction histidine kinase (bacteriophytochrome)